MAFILDIDLDYFPLLVAREASLGGLARRPTTFAGGPAIAVGFLLLWGGLIGAWTGSRALRVVLGFMVAFVLMIPGIGRSVPSLPPQTARVGSMSGTGASNTAAPALPTGALGAWRDHVNAAWDFRIVITEDDESRIVLVMRANDGSQVRRDLVEEKARATERRRFEHADSGESYVIQAATGNLGL